MGSQRALKEAAVFSGITLGLSCFVFWGPIAVLRIPTISFVSNVRGPVWAIVLFLLGGFVPSVVAMVLTRITEGKSGLASLLRRAIQVDLGWRWYAVTVLVVLVGAAGQIAVNALRGNSFDASLYVSQLPTFVPLIIIGPVSEEFGWRGYLLAKLQQRLSALSSSLAVGIVWGSWHLPLFIMAGTSQHELHLPFAGFLVGTVALSILMTWVSNNTRNSIWAAILMHWLYTYAAQVNASGVTRSPVYNWLEYSPYVAMAILVAVIGRPRGATATSRRERAGSMAMKLTRVSEVSDGRPSGRRT